MILVLFALKLLRDRFRFASLQYFIVAYSIVAYIQNVNSNLHLMQARF